MAKNILLACVLTAAGGYLLGSILFGVLISKVMYNDDVRNHGSGNAGMTNVLRTYGKLPAVLTTIGDVGKSVAAVSLGRFIFDALLSGTGAAWQSPLDPVCGAYLAAIFCMIGHSRPIFFGFKGGKGVLVGAVMLAFFDWRVFAIAFALFILSVVLTKWISLGSILGAVSFPITTWLFYRDPVLTAMAFGMAAAVVFMHRSNIGRILHGTENKFSFKSKKTIEASPDGEEK